MDADGNIVIAERFNRIMISTFSCPVDIVLGLGRFTDSLARNGTEDFAAFADFNGNGQFDFLQLAGQMTASSEATGPYAWQRLFLFGIVEVFRCAGSG